MVDNTKEKKSNGFFVALLTSRDHIIYEELVDEDPLENPFAVRYWHNPCYVTYNHKEKGINFMPFILYASMETILELPEQHVVFRYRPAKEISDAYQKFVSDFHQKLTEKNNPGMSASGTMSFH